MGAACVRNELPAVYSNPEGGNDFPARDPSLFIDNPAAYDPKAINEVGHSALDFLPAVLREIILEYFRQPQHIWSPGNWAVNPLARQAQLEVAGAVARCTNPHDYPRYWVFSEHSILIGPRRWRIQIEFEPNWYGWTAAVGVSIWPPPVFNACIFISTAEHPQSGRRHLIDILHVDRSRSQTGSLQSQRWKTIVLLEVHENNRTLCVDSEGNPGERMRRTIVPLGDLGGIEFRPSVLLAGIVKAKFIPWPHK